MSNTSYLILAQTQLQLETSIEHCLGAKICQLVLEY